MPTTDGQELEPPNNGNVDWSDNEPYTSAFVGKSRSGGAATRHVFWLEVAGGVLTLSAALGQERPIKACAWQVGSASSNALR